MQWIQDGVASSITCRPIHIKELLCVDLSSVEVEFMQKAWRTLQNSMQQWNNLLSNKNLAVEVCSHLDFATFVSD